MNYPTLSITQEATSICPAHIYFTCPICYKSEFSKKRAEHVINSNGNIDNRIEISNHICNKMKCLFFIHITDKTKKLKYRLKK